MKQLKIIFCIAFVCVQSLAFSQDKEQKAMRSFVPNTQAYDIYYPIDFQLLEDNEGIVTMTDSVSGLNITISSYTLKKKPKDVDIITHLNSFLNDSYNKQHKIEDWNSYESKFDNLVELKTNFNQSNWVWYGINSKKSVVILSLNKQTEITQEEINLVMFMIDKMIIY